MEFPTTFPSETEEMFVLPDVIACVNFYALLGAGFTTDNFDEITLAQGHFKKVPCLARSQPKCFIAKLLKPIYSLQEIF